MPCYEYENEAGEVVTLQRRVADRDQAPSGFRRITVPRQIGVVGLRPARTMNDEVTRGLHALECQGRGREWGAFERESGFSTRDFKRIWSEPSPPMTED